MKADKKAYQAGWVVLILAIVAAVVMGQARKPALPVPEPRPEYNAAAYARYVEDSADALTPAQEEAICTYNAAWDAKYGVTLAFVSPAAGVGDMEDYAYDWGYDIGLDEMDGVLLYDQATDSYYVAPGEELSGYLTSSAQNRLADALDNTSVSFGQAAVDFYGVMDGVLANALGSHGNGGYTASASAGWGSMVVMGIFFFVVLFLVLSAVESVRFDSYRRRYYGVTPLPVVYRPIFFWHTPTSAWYRRNWRPMPPPPPSGGYGGGGVSGGFGGRRSGSGSSGFHRPAGGGFGGTRGGGSRSGGFRSSGGSRGGFGGSRGGGFGGRR